MFFLIGHRGVGKTTLTSKIEGGVDLDEQILLTNQIDPYFLNDKEKDFRDLERKTLKKIIDQNKASVVSLGAGFELDKFKFPEGSKFIWIQRRSDLSGRVFLNRPRLNSQLSPIEEYFNRFSDRQELYTRIANVSLELEEGAPSEEALKIINKWVEGLTFKSTKAYFTIEKTEDLFFYSGRIELRTDLLTEKQIFSIINRPGSNQYLVALRTQVEQGFLETVLKRSDSLIDVPVESLKILDKIQFSKDFKTRIIISSHELLNKDDLAKYTLIGHHLKWAPKIKNFNELIRCYELTKGKDLSFLPRDEDNKAKWKWLRESLFYKNKINFYRTGLGVYQDQVTAYDLNSMCPSFQDLKGAVLGEEIFLSRSPGFHRRFFKENFASFYSSISFKRGEFNEINFNFVRSFGYKAFSVTSPFKNGLEFLGCKSSLNTVFLLDNKKNEFIDTDYAALKAISVELEAFNRPLVWGSGAMGKALKKLLGAHSELISVRDYDQKELEGFDALVWCAGPEAVPPLFKTVPSCVYDLEYKEHSDAKQVAISLGAGYVSGGKFFVEQALAQQAFWFKTNKEQQ